MLSVSSSKVLEINAFDIIPLLVYLESLNTYYQSKCPTYAIVLTAVLKELALDWRDAP